MNALAKTRLGKFHGPAALRRIGPLAFFGCADLKKISWGAGVKEVGELCLLDIPAVPVKKTPSFSGFLALDKKLSWVSTRATLTKLRDGPEEQTNSLPAWKIEISVSPQKFGAGLRLDKLGILKLPAGLETVKQDWFRESRIQKVIIPRSVRELEPEAFYGCLRLSSVEIEQGSALEKIGASCFSDCYFDEFRVPAHIRLIGDFAFCRCRRLSVF